MCMALPGGEDRRRPRGPAARMAEWLRFVGLLAAFWMTGLAQWIGHRVAGIRKAG